MDVAAGWLAAPASPEQRGVLGPSPRGTLRCWPPPTTLHWTHRGQSIFFKVLKPHLLPQHYIASQLAAYKIQQLVTDTSVGGGPLLPMSLSPVAPTLSAGWSLRQGSGSPHATAVRDRTRQLPAKVSRLLSVRQ